MSFRINSDLKLALGNRSSRVAILSALLMSLALLPACSSYNNGGSSGISCPGATGSFSNTSLGPSGTQWAYELSGWFLNTSNVYTPYTEAGVLVVDGNGHITSGFDDYFVSTSVTGTYSITNNGTGTINLNIVNSSGTQSLVWGITVANPGAANASGSFAVIEEDSVANSAGAAYQQSATTLAIPPTGTFVFRTHVITSGTSIAGAQDSVGLIAFSSGLTVSGGDDWVNGGVASGNFANFSGTFTAPTVGIGSVSFTDGLGARIFDYFVIDANNLLLYETDSVRGLGLGRAEMQQPPTGGFTNASFSGSFAFGSRGDTSASGAGGVNSVGQLASDGNGNITGGTLDSVRDGSPQLGQTISASTYTLASSGRVTSTLSASGAGTIAAVVYFVSPTRGFFLVSNDLTLVEDGTLDQQSTTSFSNTSFSGQYAFVMGGAVSAVPIDRTGTIQSDGNGNLGWAEQVNAGGTGNGVCLTGTYSVSSNGRTTAAVSTLSNGLVFYLISGNQAYALQGDAGAQVSGGMVLQNQTVPVIPGIF